VKIIVYSFRHEYQLSGQFRATSQLIALFKDIGWQAESIPSNSSSLHQRNQLNFELFYFNLKQLFCGAKMLNRTDGDCIVFRLPCISQLFFIWLFYRQLHKPYVVILESMAWTGINRGSFWRELCHEPILALAKRTINHPMWAKLAGSRPFHLICATQTQIKQAQKYLRGEHHFYEIKNSTLRDIPEITRKRKFDPKNVRLGFIGHDLAYKGVVEITEAIPQLQKQIPELTLMGAFSEMGYDSFAKRWLEVGGQILGKVNVAEFFDSIDILCYPIYEDYGTQTHPNIILEAMALGTPFITSKTSAMQEILDPNQIPMMERVTGESVEKCVMQMLSKDAAKVSEYLQESYQRISGEHIKNSWKNLFENRAL
jgi:glycosyltransferase involved in cell wall biosynthesis